jgi:hypothetical protein
MKTPTRKETAMNRKDSRWTKGMWIGLAGTLCALTLIAGQAWAQFASATNTSAQTNLPPPQECVAQTIDLNGAAAGTDVIVDFTAAGPLVALFNAECSVAALDDSTWLDVDILVDGVKAAPSNNDNAFCTSTGDGALEHWVSASTNVIRHVGAGQHTVQVDVRLVGCKPGDQWRIDDLSIIVFRGQ